MSALWKVKVLSILGKQVTLNVRNIHDNTSEVPDSKSFALELLHDASIQGKFGEYSFPTGPLAENINSDQSCDEAFMEKAAQEYIQSVKIVRNQTEEVISEIISAQLQNDLGITEDDDEWEEHFEQAKERYSIEADMEIVVSDEQYISHLQPIQFKGSTIARPAWDSFAT
jgi:hypothetical protein